jgi:glycerol uptake facilitator protein
MKNEPTLVQKLAAEFVGTGLLTLIGAGSVTAANFIAGVKGPSGPVIPGTTISASGAPFSLADLGIISLAFGFIIVAMVYAIGRVSGCHINPAVTIALAATGRVGWVTAAEYIVAQYLGALVGALGIVAMFGTVAAQDSILGVTHFGPNISPLQAIGAEAIGTAILVFTIFGVAVDGRAPAGWAGLVIGLIVAGIIFVVGPVTGAALNPARALGTTLIQAWYGGTAFYDQIYVYIIGPVVGGLIGAFAYLFIANPEK